MENDKRLSPVEAARQFVHQFFPRCHGALLSGSVVRGEETNTSDLDIVVFDDKFPASFRESLTAFGWPIEVFAHNLTSYKDFFENDRKSATPCLPKMVAEGVVLIDRGCIAAIKKEANELLREGPEPWTEEIVKLKRYLITDALDDFMGASDRSEELCIANTLVDLIHEFILRTNGCWVGTSKWMVRALRQYDEAFDSFYRLGRKDKIIALVDRVLEPYGGRLFNGFSIGK
ncbi:nucleotidyltransferase domain-containing protein [Anoxybacteroides tepidamans]|uniref:nucleotidyltransferase domain-containing protein n=1 Tax=Anoxybacteroides tepidamans TaxID=265948 RepID=UPI00048086EA|nr:nucleotidyltransferase domain-containing protein [Anoxybacillus tepidamans]